MNDQTGLNKTIKLFSIDWTDGLTNTQIVPAFISLSNKICKVCLLVGQYIAI